MYSLVRSEILQRKDLEDRELGGPLRLQRMYSSSIQGRAAFFEYLKDAVQNYNRRLVILKVNLCIPNPVCSILRLNVIFRPTLDFPLVFFYAG